MNKQALSTAVAQSLQEDVGAGDISAALISPGTTAHAEIRVREPAVLCGVPWVDEVYRQIGSGQSEIEWYFQDGDTVLADTVVAAVTGTARDIVSGERVALNWLQSLSATATTVRDYVSCLADSQTRLLDTRKTIPGLRQAQKYAVRCGGGYNHRFGLYDAYLIKENHIASCVSIQQAVAQAKGTHPECLVEVEVENFTELQQALSTDVDRIMLDNFSLLEIKAAVELVDGKKPLEVSGNIELSQLPAVVATGVDYISVGAITKHIRAIDYSMRITLVD